MTDSQQPAPGEKQLEGVKALADLVGLPAGYTDFPGSDLYVRMPADGGPAYCVLSLLDRACKEMARLIAQASPPEGR